jgi:hypothetical protein
MEPIGLALCIIAGVLFGFWVSSKVDRGQGAKSDQSPAYAEAIERLTVKDLRIQELQAEQRATREQLDRLLKDNSALRAAQEVLQLQVEQSLAAPAKSGPELDSVKADLAGTKAELEQARADAEQAKAASDKARAECEALRSACEALSAERTSLRAECDTLRAENTRLLDQSPESERALIADLEALRGQLQELEASRPPTSPMMSLRQVVELARAADVSEFDSDGDNCAVIRVTDGSLAIDGSFAVPADAPPDMFTVEQLREHISAVAGRPVPESEDRLALVIAPNDVWLGEVHRQDPGLFEFGLKRNVVLTTPLAVLAFLQISTLRKQAGPKPEPVGPKAYE